MLGRGRLDIRLFQEGCGKRGLGSVWNCFLFSSVLQVGMDSSIDRCRKVGQNTPKWVNGAGGQIQRWA